jgi:hypothetical protein
MPRRSRFATRRQLESLKRDVKKRFATKRQLQYLRTTNNNKIMLNDRDNLLLAAVSLIGLGFSIVQIIPGNWVRFLTFIPLTIVSWITQIGFYAYRIAKKLPFNRSLILHFRSRIYFYYGLFGYMITTIFLYFPTLVPKTIESMTLATIVLLSLLLFISWRAKKHAIGFFNLFRCRIPINFGDILLRGYLATAQMILVITSIFFFIVGYVAYPYSLALCIFSFIFGSVLMFVYILLWTSTLE